jgi:hypothetical protein
MTTREDIIRQAETLVGTLRARGETHGRGDQNFRVAADLLSVAGFRTAKAGDELEALDVVLIYELLKIARIVCGDRYEPDHWIDTAGYAIIGGAIAEGMRKQPKAPLINPYADLRNVPLSRDTKEVTP